MKKLLTIFSVLVLGLGSSLWVASCIARPKHDREVDDDLDINQDFALLNQIKKEVKQVLEAYWDTKATILASNEFLYSFLINPSNKEIINNNGEYSFLQIIEFNVK